MSNFYQNAQNTNADQITKFGTEIYNYEKLLEHVFLNVVKTTWIRICFQNSV